jgi:hypothetical protein
MSVGVSDFFAILSKTSLESATMMFSYAFVTFLTIGVTLADEKDHFLPRNPSIPVGKVYPLNGKGQDLAKKYNKMSCFESI